MAARTRSKSKSASHAPSIENRKARHDYAIEDTLECGVKLVGTEVKSVRHGQVSLNEGYIRATDEPVSLLMFGVHIAEYPPAGAHRQHAPGRARVLLAQKREIKKLAEKTRAKGATIVPLKMYFKNGMVKVLIGIAHGRRKADKRQDLAARDAQREMDRAMSKRR